jgi:hypothetical protein
MVEFHKQNFNINTAGNRLEIIGPVQRRTDRVKDNMV